VVTNARSRKLTVSHQGRRICGLLMLNLGDKMTKLETLIKKSANRRTFLKTGITAAGAATMGAGLLGGGLSASVRPRGRWRYYKRRHRHSQVSQCARADRGRSVDSIQRTRRYPGQRSLGSERGKLSYTAALTILDGDMAQYIHDNTDDEISHAAFLKAYLDRKAPKQST